MDGKEDRYDFLFPAAILVFLAVDRNESGTVYKGYLVTLMTLRIICFINYKYQVN